MDRHGFALMPQPSNNPDDPLNWSPTLKFFVALQVSWLAFLGPMSSAVANPAFVLLGRAFDITPVQASYSLTVYICFAGIGPLLIVPFANIYGRRPVYLVCALIAAVTNIAAGYSKTWSGILASRAINGMFGGTPPAIGAATICDLFFMHERGFYMGIFTLFLTNGPHVAPLMGGFIAQYLGWQWCYRIPGFIQCGTFVVILFCLPETLYSRDTSSTTHKPHTFLELLTFRATLPDRKLRLIDWWRNIYMLKYLLVSIPGMYYMTAFGYGSVIFATTGSQLFREFYGFTVSQTGLMLSIPLLIGCVIGEANAGWLIDWMVVRHAKKNNGEKSPEARLTMLWLGLLVPIGLIIEGVCLSHYKTVSWVGSAFGMGIANLGLQAATTVTYAYTTDVYKPQSAEISSLLNAFRSIYSMIISFYAIPLGEEIGFQYAWLVFALINIVFFVPFMALKWFGPRLRAKSWQSPPTFHKDL
ncbi:major facilitator superfamily domain-containing protein [Lophiotrema nucula]|uniref:Major facilitator superfamily domain-containing protein n=1 Tax=Lophiotrema nucula TaxID=690887 RepID=A0A6A5Z6Z9_9PLEO|nr:major facilitator superfamily domain-containing protein [Lophiotrema nucula]